MSWLWELHTSHPVAHALGIISLVCLAGSALGSCRFRGVGLGTAGVLFAGIVFGHFGSPVDTSTLDFVKEFGLILFVFMIGLQLGPGFFAALRQEGIRLNLLAVVIILLGAASAALLGAMAGFDSAAVLGIFSGASVNMPSLGAAVQTLGTLPGLATERLALPAQACAVTFPTAILTSLVTLLLLQKVFRIDPAREAAEELAKRRARIEPLERRTLVVTQPSLDGVKVDVIRSMGTSPVGISRVRHAGETLPATRTTVVRVGDLVTAVGTRASLDALEPLIGHRSDEDLVLAGGQLTFRRVVVTDRNVLGKTVGELGLDDRYGVAVTRITRADLEMTAVPDLRLQFGDMLQIVGRTADLDRAAVALGNSLKELNETHFIPLFLGLFFGILVGTMPIVFPGLPQPVRLGLAGGPLLVALALGRLGHFGRLVFHMPVNANLAFREFGIALFFAAVGLDAGPKFFATAFSSVGLKWLLAGAFVTGLPLLLVGMYARAVCRMPYAVLSGLIAGSTTNPPALAFASNMAGSDAPTVAYATVYPVTMLLRILTAQVLALLLCG